MEPKYYIVSRIDGDYAWLACTSAQEEPYFIARALLPEELAKSDLCLLSDDIKSRIYMINTFDGEAIAAEIDAMVEVKTSR